MTETPTHFRNKSKLLLIIGIALILFVTLFYTYIKTHFSCVDIFTKGIVYLLLCTCITLISLYFTGQITVKKVGITATGGFGIFLLLCFYPPKFMVFNDCQPFFDVTVKPIFKGNLSHSSDLALEISVDNIDNPAKTTIGTPVTLSKIPSVYLNKKVALYIKSETFQLAKPDSQYFLGTDSLYIVELKRKNLDIVKGYVKTETNQGINGAEIYISDLPPVKSTPSGFFEIHIPEDHQNEDQTITVKKSGYYDNSQTTTVDSRNELQFILNVKKTN